MLEVLSKQASCHAGAHTWKLAVGGLIRACSSCNCVERKYGYDAEREYWIDAAARPLTRFSWSGLVLTYPESLTQWGEKSKHDR